MGAMQSSRMPSRAWLRYARAKKPAKSRALKASWAVFIVLGIPLGLMAILGPLTYAGYYVETLGILLYRHGREAGYHHGKTAGKAVARNIAEGLGGAVIEPAPPPGPVEPPKSGDAWRDCSTKASSLASWSAIKRGSPTLPLGC